MAESCCIHVVDGDSARRAAVAHELYGLGVHVEIYESLDELLALRPRAGSVLVCADEPSFDPAAAVERIGAEAPALAVALFSADPCPERIVVAMLAGALDYLRWPSAPEALKAKLESLARAGRARCRTELRVREAARRVGALSRREREVLDGLVAGASSKAIARRLGISPRTVEVHRYKLMHRLGASSLAEAIRIGLEGGIVDWDAELSPPLELAA